MKPLTGVLAALLLACAWPAAATWAADEQAGKSDVTGSLSNRVPRGTYHDTMREAEADMARIEASTPLLIADFQVIDEQERSLEKEARMICSRHRTGRPSSRVDRYGAHVLAFDKLWRECLQADALYSSYLDGCASHFRVYHRPDLELQMRQSPCGRSILTLMGAQYARLHRAVLEAHAERLKLLAAENSLRSELGTTALRPDKSVRGELLPSRVHQE